MPKFGINSVYEVVHDVLSAHPETRDSYQQLAKRAYTQFGIDPATTNFLEFLELIETEQLPAWSTVERMSRDIQEHDESLRGVLWEERQKAAAEAEVKKQMREARRALKAKQADDAAVEAEFKRQEREMLAQAPQPWKGLGLTEAEYRAAGLS